MPLQRALPRKRPESGLWRGRANRSATQYSLKTNPFVRARTPFWPVIPGFLRFLPTEPTKPTGGGHTYIEERDIYRRAGGANTYRPPYIYISLNRLVRLVIYRGPLFSPWIPLIFLPTLKLAAGWIRSESRLAARRAHPEAPPEQYRVQPHTDGHDNPSKPPPRGHPRRRPVRTVRPPRNRRSHPGGSARTPRQHRTG